MGATFMLVHVKLWVYDYTIESKSVSTHKKGVCYER
jgi:hypothetical protein